MPPADGDHLGLDKAHRCTDELEAVLQEVPGPSPLSPDFGSDCTPFNL